MDRLAHTRPGPRPLRAATLAATTLALVLGLPLAGCGRQGKDEERPADQGRASKSQPSRAGASVAGRSGMSLAKQSRRPPGYHRSEAGPPRAARAPRARPTSQAGRAPKARRSASDTAAPGAGLSAPEPARGSSFGLGGSSLSPAASPGPATVPAPAARARTAPRSAGTLRQAGAPDTAGGAAPPRAEAFGQLPVFDGARPTPTPTFEHPGVNPTVDTAAERLSTFAVARDTASLSIAARYLREGRLPPEAAVRVESFLNALDYGYGPPRGAEPLALQAELVPSPYRRGYHLLKLGLRAALPRGKRKPLAVALVLDGVAGDSAPDRGRALELVLGRLQATLGRGDQVTVITTGGSGRVLLPLQEVAPGSAHRNKVSGSFLTAPLRQANLAGSRRLMLALRLAYGALGRAPPGALRQVILLGPGDGSPGTRCGLSKLSGCAEVSQAAPSVPLTVIGCGRQGYHDPFLASLARAGQGGYHYVADAADAARALPAGWAAARERRLEDVKLQVAFDPRAVTHWRLLGYERLGLRARDLQDAHVAGGQLGAGETITALYEVRLDPRAPRQPLGTLRVGYRRPSERRGRSFALPLPTGGTARTLTQASPATRLALLAAGLAEKLRGAYWAHRLSYATLAQLLAGLPAAWRKRRDVRSLGDALARAGRLDSRRARHARSAPVDRADFDRLPIFR